MWIGRREVKHDLAECTGYGVAFQVGGKADMKPPQVERGEDVKLPVLLHQQLGLAFAEELQSGTKRALGSQGTLGDGALHSVLAGGEPDDLRGLAITKRGEDD